MEDEPKQLTEFEKLQWEEKKALEEHERLLKALENDPKDSELRVKVDQAYDAWNEIKRKIVMLEGNKEKE